MNRNFWWMGCLAMVVASIAGSQHAEAQTNAIASGSWASGGTWGNGVPGTATHANLDGGHTVTVDSLGAVARNLDIGAAEGEWGVLEVTSGSLTITASEIETELSSIRIGRDFGSGGAMLMSGGNVRIEGAAPSGFAIGDLLVGDWGDAEMVMTGGQLVARDEIFLGMQGTSTGIVNISGGHLEAEVRSIIVGFHGTGELNVSGTASVYANNDLLVGFQPDSIGVINQSGGIIDVNWVRTNSFTGPGGSHVEINMTGGTVNARIAYILGQDHGHSTLNHSGGVINVLSGNGDMVVSDLTGNTAIYNISGSAEVQLMRHLLIGGWNGSNGMVNQTGGTIIAGDTLFIGRDNSVGEWNLDGGEVAAYSAFLGDFDNSFGTMKVFGGKLELYADLNVGAAIASNASPSRSEPTEPGDAQGQALNANGTFIVEGTGGEIHVYGNLLANPADKSPFRSGPGHENGSILRFVLDSTGVSTINVGLIADLDGAVIDIDDTAGYFAANSAGSLTLIEAASGFGNVYTITQAEAAGNGKGFSLAPGLSSLFDLQILPSGGGERLVLSPSAGGGLAGDFDNDGIVDGHDFLLWQRNSGVGNLADWEAGYGTNAPVTANSIAVPEPTGWGLAAWAVLGTFHVRRRAKRQR